MLVIDGFGGRVLLAGFAGECELMVALGNVLHDDGNELLFGV